MDTYKNLMNCDSLFFYIGFTLIAMLMILENIKMKKTLYLLILTAFLPQLMSAQVSMKAAVDSSLKSNGAIKAANLKLDSRESSVKSAWGHLLPSVQVDFFYTHLGEDLTLNLDKIRGLMINFQSSNSAMFDNLKKLYKDGQEYSKAELGKITQLYQSNYEKAVPHFIDTVKEQNFPQAMLSIKQPIFTGGKILAGVRAAEAVQEIEKSRASAESQVIVMEAVNSYLSVLLSEENYKVRSMALDGVKKHNQRALRMLEEGIIAKHDKLRADVALSEAERNLFEANEKRKIAKIALQSVMQNSGNDITLSDTIGYKTLNRQLPDFITTAKAANTNIQQSRAAEKAFHEKANIKFGSYFPTVFGYGFYNIFDNYMSELEPHWGVGIGASFEVFDGFRRSNDYQEAKAEAESQSYTTQEIERKIELLIRSRYMELRLAEDRYKQLNSAIDQAEENLRLNSKRFETGMGTSLEVIDAELSLESIRLQRIKALNDYYTQIAALYYASGEASNFVEFWSK